MDDIIKIVDSPEKSSLLFDGASGTLNHQIKKQETITAKGVIRARKGQEGGIPPFVVLPLVMRVLGKGVMDQIF